MDTDTTSIPEFSADGGRPEPTGLRTAGGVGLVLAGFALGLFGLGLGWYVVIGFRARPVAAHDIATFLGVFFLFLFAVAQVGAGVGILAAGAGLLREAWRRAAHPHEPWMWRADWAAGVIKHSRGGLVPVLWVAALVWNGVLWGALLPLVPVREWIEREAFAGLACVALFVGLGVGLLVWALATTLRWLRFRESVFEMVSVPGRIGGSLEGTIRAHVSLKPEDHMIVRLVCEQSPGLGGTRQAFWQPEYTVGGEALAVSSQYSAVPVKFEIPQSCRPTTWRIRNPFAWRLVVSAGGRAGYRAEFPVPVFHPDGGPVQESPPDPVAVPSDDTADPRPG